MQHLLESASPHMYKLGVDHWMSLVCHLGVVPDAVIEDKIYQVVFFEYYTKYNLMRHNGYI